MNTELEPYSETLWFFRICGFFFLFNFELITNLNTMLCFGKIKCQKD